MSLAKTEARKTCESLSLLEGRRVDIVEKIGHTFLNNDSMFDDWLTLLLNGEDDINESGNGHLDVICLLTYRCIIIDF